MYPRGMPSDRIQPAASRPGPGSAPVVLVVPPFGSLDRPSLGVHVLQACARAAGHRVRIEYANLSLAARLGERQYANFEHMALAWLAGERLFARAAHDLPPLGADGGERILAEFVAWLAREGGRVVAPDQARSLLLDLEARAHAWIPGAVDAILAGDPEVVGCTSTFEQTGASLALLREVKRRRPGILTLIGGANCEAAMGEGIAAVAPWVDHVFSGESEATFTDFLARRARGEPSPRILVGEPCRDLEALPTTDFSEFHGALERLLPGSEAARTGQLWIPYESSRGCWWGQKRHCTFCGLNGEGMGFRQKSPDKVVHELRTLVSASPTRRIAMTDNIMPHQYFRTLLPRLAGELPGLEIGYEQKSNLTLEKVRLLREAGVTAIQPGIEAISSGLLRLMDKGVTASQNVAALRYASAYGIAMHWNLLVAFPNDLVEFYRETLALVPRLRHLPPPAIVPVMVSRFSPYFDRAEEHGVSGLAPLASYRDVFPPGSPVDRIAYHFTGTYPSAALDPGNRPLMLELGQAVASWRALWARSRAEPPTLRIEAQGAGFRLLDTRGLGLGPERIDLSAEEAGRLLVRRPVARTSRQAYAEAVRRGWMAELDGSWVPLALASPALLHRFEAAAEDAVLAAAV